MNSIPETDASTVSIMIVEDHAVTRDGLRMMLEAVGFRVVGEAGDAEAAASRFRDLRPDISLVDIRLGSGPNGIDVAAELCSIAPTCKVIMFASDALEADIHRARKAGACGFLVKTLPRETIIRAIFEAHHNGVCQPYGKESSNTFDPLTEREMEVLVELRRGLTSSEIGCILAMSEHTVKSHLKAIFSKLHAADRTEAVAVGFQLGYLRVR